MDSEDSAYPSSDMGETTTDQNTAPAETGSDDSQMSGETSLLPKSFFSGKELTVGSTCEVKIVHVYDDEVEVEYVPMDSEESGETKPDDESMEGAMGKMDAMATDGDI